MVDIKLINNADDELYKMIDEEFNKLKPSEDIPSNVVAVGNPCRVIKEM